MVLRVLRTILDNPWDFITLIILLSAVAGVHSLKSILTSLDCL
jgi:hypothetical protein